MPILSFTFITIPFAFDLYVFEFPFCHVVPPSKLYAASASPDLESAAFTVSVTSLFVHLPGLPVTPVIFGSSWSKLLNFITSELTVFVPSVILAINVVSLSTVIDFLYIFHVVPPSILISFFSIFWSFIFFISGYVNVIVFVILYPPGILSGF